MSDSNLVKMQSVPAAQQASLKGRQRISKGGLRREGSAGPAADLAAIVEYSNDAIFRRTLDGKITTWNAAAKRMFGYSAKEVIGRSSAFLLPPDRHEELRKILKLVRRGGSLRRFETERLRKIGRVVSVSLTISPIRRSESFPGLPVCARSIPTILIPRSISAR